MNRLIQISIFAISICLVMQTWGQGVTRSHGIGFRGGFWKTESRALSVEVTSSSNTTVDVGGAGGSLYFFSRIYGSLYTEATLGAVGQVHVDSKLDGEDGEVEVSAMMPVLLGLRYDFLPERSTSSFEPYVAGGVGTYWLTDTYVGGDVADGRVSTGSDFFGGMYVGAGSHLMLRSWFGLNFDTRYHFVNFNPVNENSGLEIGFGMSFMWGSERELFRIRDIKVLVEDIYPAYYQFYSTYPIALLTVANTAGYPIEINVKSQIERFSDREKQSGFVKIEKGETADIPIHVFLGPELLEISNRESAALDLVVEARAGVKLRKTISANLMLHSKNAWDGQINKLSFFVTPESDSVQAMRQLASDQVADSLGDYQVNMALAKQTFNLINQKKIHYQSDPNIPFYKDDRVQFADNTLSLGTGDCDDLAVLYASLLESLGIRTAFIDVNDPEKAMAHVYLMFDTGVSPENGNMISGNEKRYIIREKTGKSTIWIPMETTLVNQSFDQAWEQGALQYLNDAVLRNGLTQGWISVVDVE